MRFVNNTPLPAATIPSSGERDLFVLGLCCATYDLCQERGARLSKNQRPLVVAQQSPYPGDDLFLRTGVSVCATGFVYPEQPGGSRGLARLLVGSEQRVVAAFGARIWKEKWGNPSITEPEAFERLEMTWENAYGGSVFERSVLVEVDGEQALMPEHEAAFPLNTDGTGFYNTREQALGRPLPSLEDPETLIREWSDRPEPVCLAPYPIGGGLRAAHLVDSTSGAVEVSRIGLVTGRAAPRNVFARAPSGTPMEVHGMTRDGCALRFLVPQLPVVFIVEANGGSSTVQPELDAIDIDAEARQVRFLYRSTMTIPLVAFSARAIRCEATPSLNVD